MTDEQYEVFAGTGNADVKKDDLCETVQGLLADGAMERKRNCVACGNQQVELLPRDKKPAILVSGNCKMVRQRTK